MSQLSLRVELPNKSSFSPYNKRRGSVYVSCALGEEECVQLPLAVARLFKKELEREGIVLESRTELFSYLSKLDERCAAQRLTSMLNRRDYACAEARRKLHDDGYHQSTIDALIERAQAGHALDDKRYGAIFVRSKLAAGWGIKRIRRELAFKEIDLTQLEGWPDEFVDLEDQAQRAYELVSRRHLTGKNDFQKLVRFLLSKGYGTSDAISAVKRFLAESEKETDEPV